MNWYKSKFRRAIWWDNNSWIIGELESKGSTLAIGWVQHNDICLPVDNLNWKLWNGTEYDAAGKQLQVQCAKPQQSMYYTKIY